MANRHLLIYGHVQGVCYRASMCREASRLGVTGWVRNRRDGSVEAMLHGDLSAIEALTEWARNGPPGARVRRLEASEGGKQERVTGFIQRDTS